MAKPIFILGVHRSGTTWVANILCAHSKIAGIQAERHFGIHESAFFCIVKDRYGDIKKDEYYIEFLENFSNSDYFILSGLDKNYFYKNRATSYDDFFKIMMDKYADSQKKEFWLEKTPAHLLYFHELKDFFPDAKFIVSKRNVIDSIKSDIRMKFFDEKMQRKNRFPKIFFVIFLVFRYHFYYSNLYKQKKSEDYLMVDYEDLKKDRLGVTKRICDFLNINFEQNLMEDKYRKNTLFVKDKERGEVLSKGEVVLIKFLDKVFSILPNQFFRCFLPMYRREFKKQDIPDWYYSIKKEELT